MSKLVKFLEVSDNVCLGLSTCFRALLLALVLLFFEEYKMKWFVFIIVGLFGVGFIYYPLIKHLLKAVKETE